MTTHSFDTDVAGKVGVIAATIYQNIAFWCDRNRANLEHMHEGHAWTYNSNRAFKSLFPYLSVDQIRRALEKLVGAGYIGVGNFNETPYDRTKWYCDLRQIDLANLPNETGENPEPIPDTKPDTKPDTSDGSASDLFSGKVEAPEKSETEDKFEVFWAAFPPGRKNGKRKARSLFSQITTGKHRDIAKVEADTLISAARAFAETQPDPKFTPMPTTWLNDERWEGMATTETARYKPRRPEGDIER